MLRIRADCNNISI